MNREDVVSVDVMAVAKDTVNLRININRALILKDMKKVMAALVKSRTSKYIDGYFQDVLGEHAAKVVNEIMRETLDQFKARKSSIKVKPGMVLLPPMPKFK